MLGFHLPQGTNIGATANVMHHHPDVFEDPARFWPERWMKETTSSEKLQRMERAFFAVSPCSRVLCVLILVSTVRSGQPRLYWEASGYALYE